MRRYQLKVTDDILNNADLFAEIDGIADQRELYASEFRPSIEIHDLVANARQSARTLADILRTGDTGPVLIQ